MMFLNFVASVLLILQCNSPIWWYTKEPFIYVTLNQALRKQDVEVTMIVVFFFNDLHQQIEQVYSTTRHKIQTTLYRGQELGSKRFGKLQQNQGDLLSFNNFLSTSIDCQVAFQYASSAHVHYLRFH